MISLIVVNYRSASLALNAIRSARKATTAPLQVIVVDNSCDPAEAETLRPHCDVLVVSPQNVGYAAAINAGRRVATSAVLLVSNPDVIFGEDSISYLVAALDEENAAVAGPALFWDDAHRWILPPADANTLRDKLDEVMASRFPFWARRRDRRRIGGRLRFWTLPHTSALRAISGAVMAIRTADLDRVGGFDERFFLYFEESDFLRRIQRSGRSIVYVPRARCRHLFNQSASSEPVRSAALFAESEMRFLEKSYGVWLARLLKKLEKPQRLVEPLRIEPPIRLASAGLLVEVSPLRSFATAAGHFPASATIDLPAEVWAAYRDAVLYARIVDPRTLQPVATYGLSNRLK